MGTSNDYNAWDGERNVNITRNDEYTTMAPSDVTIFGDRYVQLTNTVNCIEFDVKVSEEPTLTTFFSLRNNTSSKTTFTGGYTGIEMNNWYHICIEWTDTQYRAIVDGVEKRWLNFTDEIPINRFYFTLLQNSNRIIHYKNVVIYPI